MRAIRIAKRRWSIANELTSIDKNFELLLQTILQKLSLQYRFSIKCETALFENVSVAK